MFVAIEILDEQGNEYIEKFNAFHITRISISDPRNVDAGSYIYLRTGDMIYTTYPIDILDQKINEVIEHFSVALLVQKHTEFTDAKQKSKKDS